MHHSICRKFAKNSLASMTIPDIYELLSHNFYGVQYCDWFSKVSKNENGLLLQRRIMARSQQLFQHSLHINKTLIYTYSR